MLFKWPWACCCSERAAARATNARRAHGSVAARAPLVGAREARLAQRAVAQRLLAASRVLAALVRLALAPLGEALRALAARATLAHCDRSIDRSIDRPTD